MVRIKHAADEKIVVCRFSVSVDAVLLPWTRFTRNERNIGISLRPTALPVSQQVRHGFITQNDRISVRKRVTLLDRTLFFSFNRFFLSHPCVLKIIPRIADNSPY